MSERNLDFDTVVDRVNTDCLKYDFAVRRGMPADVLPLWVADMDFKTSSYIQDALIQEVNHGIYGYSEAREEYFDILKQWMKRHYDWDVKERWLVKTPGIVYALGMAVHAFTDPGDAIMQQQPVYYPFTEVILDNDRRLVDNTLVQEADGTYRMDFEDMERKIIAEKVKLFFLCNPHNPVGRVWTTEELTRLGEICLRHHVIVVSDEIHADFVFRGKHQVFADIREDFAAISITCTSPSKTFNLAGLQVSNLFIPDREIRKKFRHAIDQSGYSQLNVMGLVACKAAYRDGEEWYQAMHQYVYENIQYTKKFVEERIPHVKMTDLEGTYLVWLDFRELGLDTQELEDLIIHKAGLWLDSGKIFGQAGQGFQRINTACPRSILTEALERIAREVGALGK